MEFEEMLKQSEETVESLTSIVSEVDRAEIDEADKKARWLAKRVGKFTASVCDKLMSGGRGKGVEWGETAKKEILAVMHERFTGVKRMSLDLPQFRWGHENEPLAFEYYKANFNPRAVYSMEGDDIIFIEPFEGFGISPDSATFDDNDILEGITEIKCPESGVVHLSYCMIEDVAKGDDYYYQIISQFLSGCKWIDFVSFDPRFPDGHPLKMHVVRLLRENYLFDIVALEKRLMVANSIIDLKQLSNINNHE